MRYSIFGWWHQKGKRYDLDTSAEGGKAKKPKAQERARYNKQVVARHSTRGKH